MPARVRTKGFLDGGQVVKGEVEHSGELAVEEAFMIIVVDGGFRLRPGVGSSIWSGRWIRRSRRS